MWPWNFGPALNSLYSKANAQGQQTAAIETILKSWGRGEIRMKKLLACVVTAAILVPLGADAHERPLDAGLGAVSGAVFFGPVGAIAGGVIGYTKGPAISRTLGLSGRHRHHVRRSRQ